MWKRRRRAPVRGPESRDAVFDVDPRSLGLMRDVGRQLWGVAVDWSVESGHVTVLSLIDGTTSLYASTGGGLIGVGEENRTVAAQSEALVFTVERNLDLLEPAEDRSPPAPGCTRIWGLGYGGLQVAEVPTAELESREHPLWRAYLGFRDVLNAIGRIDGTVLGEPPP